MARANDGHLPGPVPPGTVFRNKRGAEWTTADWTPGSERETELRTLHASGLSLSEIGRRMGIGKDAAISKARKLGLKGHQPTPRLVDDGTLTKRQLRHIRRREARNGAVETRPTPVAIPRALTVAPRERPSRAIRVPKAIPVMMIQEAPMVIAKTLRRVSECCWPIGHPGTKDFRYCDDPHRNKTYCDAHERDAYTHKRQENAA